MQQGKPLALADLVLEVGPEARTEAGAETEIETGAGGASAGGLWALDAQELGLLAVLRHLMRSHAAPESQSWEIGLQIAHERWGAAAGGRLLLAAGAFLRALRAARPGEMPHADPLDPVARRRLGPEERRMMRMLQAMRRDLAPAARAEMGRLTGGRMDPGLVRSGLQLVRCLPAPGQGGVLCGAGPGLRRLH